MTTYPVCSHPMYGPVNRRGTSTCSDNCRKALSRSRHADLSD